MVIFPYFKNFPRTASLNRLEGGLSINRVVCRDGRDHLSVSHCRLCGTEPAIKWLGETGYWSSGQRLSDSTPSQGYSTLDESSVPEYLVGPSLSITLPEPLHPLTRSRLLAPVFPLVSVAAPNSERGRRLSSVVVDEPTDPLNPAHRTTPVPRPSRSASLDQGSPKTLATMARPWTTGRLAAQGPGSGNGLKGKGPRSGRRTRTYPVAQQPSKRRARLSG